MTTMTAEELRAIITPTVEADLKAAGLWPERLFGTINASLGNNGGEWCWWGLEPVHPDDARAQIERRLVKWLITNSLEHPSIWREVAENSVDRYRITFSIGWESKDVSGPTLLQALLAAFAGRSGGK